SSVVAHLVGYVGEITETERAQRRFAAVRLGGLLGKGGLERQYDDSLRGADGVRFVEVSALGRVVREGGTASRLPPVPGRAVHTTVDLVLADAIAQSCDVYFYQLGLKLGLTSMLEDATGLGFHSRTGIDLPGEITSEFPGGTDYYDRVYGPRRWTAAVTLNLAIGQGENAQTLVNMIRFYQMLASDGRARSPYLVHPAP